MLLAALAPILALAVRRKDPTLRTLAVVLGTTSLLTMPQLLQRADGTHALYTVTPALILAGALVERARSAAAASGPRLAAALGGVALILPTWSGHLAFASPAPYAAETRTHGRFGGTAELEPSRQQARRDVVAWLRATTGPGEPIWSGCTDHLQTSANELDLYFLADRPGPTKWLQFDPGLQDSPEIQRRIIADFERTKPAALALATCERTDAGNGGRSDLFDRYLARAYRVERTLPGYRLLVRR